VTGRRGPRRQSQAKSTSKAFLSIDEVAILLGESRSTIYRSIDRGDFPIRVITINGRRRISRRALERLIEGSDETGLVEGSQTDLPGSCPD
jgi:excisionase family DNA binding protein